VEAVLGIDFLFGKRRATLSGASSFAPVIALEDLSDAALVASCRAGERAAFEVLLNRHRDRVLNLAFQLLHDRDEAEDVAQDSFANAFAALDGFRGDAQFSTWLYRIAFNLCVHRKRRARPTESFEERFHDCGDRASLPGERAVARLMVQETLAQLSPPLRAALVLREIHELSYEEISQILQIPIGTVRSRLNEARRQFREAWGELEK
jgi:RNA polymerase sigma-70 factor (ECF subfamily)